MTQTTAQPPLETLTFQTARDALERGLAALAGGQTVFDLGSVKLADSSGVAVLLAMQRAARKAGVAVSFVNLPLSLKSLANLYGVDTLLVESPANLHHH
ncbi:STAS domain-containing protein [Massilia sp. TWR1-2-2]|uniref:STAS domain-containing protein n=1 Tax=Massilia sp. TWR1-2-2 TaxID=2804584 RepID=UPI003CF4A3EC